MLICGNYIGLMLIAPIHTVSVSSISRKKMLSYCSFIYSYRLQQTMYFKRQEECGKKAEKSFKKNIQKIHGIQTIYFICYCNSIYSLSITHKKTEEKLRAKKIQNLNVEHAHNFSIQCCVLCMYNQYIENLSAYDCRMQYYTHTHTNTHEMHLYIWITPMPITATACVLFFLAVSCALKKKFFLLFSVPKKISEEE